MVSFQAPLSPKNLDQQRKTLSYLDTSPSKKRKWDADQYRHDDLNEIKPWIFNPTPKTSSSTVDLHLETPLPSEWQRCLDIESGEINFYNTRTKRRTHKDSRRSELETPSHMSLDLELNLPCGDDHGNNHAPSRTGIKNPGDDHPRTKPKTLSLFTTNSSTAEVEEEAEMVAAACKKCHMLVVLCKSSPACPNCKFMHPLESSSAVLPKFMIKPGLGLSC